MTHRSSDRDWNIRPYMLLCASYFRAHAVHIIGALVLLRSLQLTIANAIADSCAANRLFSHKTFTGSKCKLLRMYL